GFSVRNSSKITDNSGVKWKSYICISHIKKQFLRFARTVNNVHKNLLPFSKAGRGHYNIGCTQWDLQNYSRDLKALIKDSYAHVFIDNFRRKREMDKPIWVDVLNDFFTIHWRKSSSSKYYFWLFETFLKAMGGHKPIVIITDHDLAMKIAIEEVFNGSTHRFCNTSNFVFRIIRKRGDLAQARDPVERISPRQERSEQSVRFSLERENLAQARALVSGNLKIRGLLAQASHSRLGEATQL
ncbi:hypothetical protein Lal_00027207, partial [Lupinus albus]